MARPSRPITPQATAVHGYRDADVCDQPTMAEVWPAFREFVGGDLLVAHNGHTFDVPVLRRLAAGLPGLDELVFFDTLPLARSLIDSGASLPDLCHRFGVSPGRSHHAIDEQRIAIRRTTELHKQLLFGGMPQHALDELPNFGLTEPRDRNQVTFAIQIANQLVQVARLPYLRVAVSTNHQDARVLHLARDEPHHEQRGLIRVVEIVDLFLRRDAASRRHTPGSGPAH